jgi:hypothetical protein
MFAGQLICLFAFWAERYHQKSLSKHHKTLVAKHSNYNVVVDIHEETTFTISYSSVLL